MTDALRVVMEIGTKGRRVVAGALDWPGLDRWGRDEAHALEKLAAYVSRYRPVAERAGLGAAYPVAPSIDVVERYTGSSSTDFWGIAHTPSGTEAEVLDEDALARRLALVDAGWAYFDEIAGRVTAELRPQPRGGGRSRDEIVRHVYASERHNFWRKVAIREDDGVRLRADELAAHRARFVDEIRAYNAEARKARKWPIQFLLRRTGQHVLDHAWELEDRDLSP